MQYLEDIRNITLYQLVQYVNSTYGTRIEHNKVMTRQMPGIVSYQDFGPCGQIVETSANKYAPEEITTYKLTPQQCVVVAAKICIAYLVQIVKKLETLQTIYQYPRESDMFVNIPKITLHTVLLVINKRYHKKYIHSKIMARKMPALIATETFGSASMINIDVTIGSGAKRSIRTYEFDKIQAVVVAAHVCIPYLIHIVKLLDMIERTFAEPNTQDELAIAIHAYANYILLKIYPPMLTTLPTFKEGVDRFYYRNNSYLTGMDGLRTDCLILHAE